MGGIRESKKANIMSDLSSMRRDDRKGEKEQNFSKYS